MPRISISLTPAELAAAERAAEAQGRPVATYVRDVFLRKEHGTTLKQLSDLTARVEHLITRVEGAQK